MAAVESSSQPEGLGGGAERPPQSLPCLSSNNVTEGEKKQGLNGINLLQPNHKKTAHCLVMNVAEMCKRHPVERVGMLTLTFADHVTDPREARKRFRSLAFHVLNKRYKEWIRVLERTQSGRIHFHLLVVAKEDIRGGIDFDAIARGDYRSAPRSLRGEWAFWRQTAPRYRFGRTELLPVRSNVQAISRYVGKYVSKHIGARKVEDKGVRLVGYSQGACVARTRFAWVSPGGWLWRQKVGALAEELGFRDLEDFREQFGSKWAFALQETVMAIDLSARPGGVTYPNPAHAEADGHAVPDNAMGPVHVEGKVEAKEQFRADPIWVPSKYDERPCAPYSASAAEKERLRANLEYWANFRRDFGWMDLWDK